MKSFTTILIAATILSAHATVELTGDNFQEMTSGKKVMIKFFAP